MTRVTLRDVAAKVGVSQQTVTNALNGNPKLTEATRSLVLQAVAELGYQPNHAAQALRSKRSYTIAAVQYQPNQEQLADMYTAVANAAIGESLRARGYETLSHAINPRVTDPLTSLRTLFRTGRVDGAILFAYTMPDELLTTLSDWEAAMVVFDGNVPSAGIPSVWALYHGGVASAVSHLVRRGRRRIAFVTGTPVTDPQASATARARWDGFREGLRAHGVPLDPAYVVSTAWSYEGGRQALHTLWQQPEPPDAVVAASDAIAIGVIHGARARGLQVPHDVAVTGFDDYEIARYIEPPLTTVRLPLSGMAQRAVELLLARVEGDLTPHHEALPTELIVRESA